MRLMLNLKRLCPAACALMLIVLSSCGEETPLSPRDVTPPARVTDLRVSVMDSTVILTWTATGDDTTSGRASAYDVRYSAHDLSYLGSWAAATRVQDSPAPQEAGLQESLALTGLDQDVRLYFGIKTGDEGQNWSDISNVVSATVYSVRPQDSPENVVWNLRSSYGSRNIELYSGLIGSDFEFEFQPQDAFELGQATWLRDRDLTATEALFSAPDLWRIEIDLMVSSIEPVSGVALPSDSVKVTVSPVLLDFWQNNGVVFEASCCNQEMWIRRGLGGGEDASKWYIYHWKDVPRLLKPGFVRPYGDGDPVDRVLTTWGFEKIRGEESGT